MSGYPDAPLGVEHGPGNRHAMRQLLLRHHRFAAAPADPPRAGTDDWLARARRAAAVNDHYATAYAARQATHDHGLTAELCDILARAHTGLGRLDEALDQTLRAIRLEPDQAQHHLTLAGIFEHLGNWPAALRCYRRAWRLDPDSEAAAIGTAAVHIQAGAPGEAVRVLTAVYPRCQDRRRVGDCLAVALVEAAEAIPLVREPDAYFVTSGEEVARMRKLLAEADQAASDPTLRATIADVRAYADRCARREFRPRLLWRRGSARAYLLLAAVAVLVGVLAVATHRLWPWTVAGPLLSLTLACGGLVHAARVPRWLLNRWTYGH